MNNINIESQGIKAGDIKNPTSYKNILSDILKFKKSGGSESSEFNLFEDEGAFYFKIFFYFNNPDSSQLTSNFLGIDWALNSNEKVKSPEYYKFSNTAHNYLLLNNELERAELLEKFIYLLSDINSESPWYFSELEGLEAALERKIFTPGEEFKIDEKPRQITIKCLSDAYDTRIGTLLDLYRAITYSYVQKKEVIPANLRKFDMGIYIFQMPTHFMHGLLTFYNESTGFDKNGKQIKVKGYKDFGKFYDTYIQSYDIHNKEKSSSNLNTNRTSSKYLEFHNCEFDYNSSKSGYTAFSNKAAIPMEYKIVINYDDCYENRYNEFLDRDIGDFINTDLISLAVNNAEKSKSQIDHPEQARSIEARSMRGLNEHPNPQFDEENISIIGGKLGETSPSSNLKALSNIPNAENLIPGVGDTQVGKSLGRKSLLDYLPFEIPKFDVNNMIDQGMALASGLLKKYTVGLIPQVPMGNIYGHSVSNIVDGAFEIASGNVLGGLGQILHETNERKNYKPSPRQIKNDETIPDYPNINERNKEEIKNNINKYTEKIPGYVDKNNNDELSNFYQNNLKNNIQKNNKIEKLPGYDNINKDTIIYSPEELAILSKQNPQNMAFISPGEKLPGYEDIEKKIQEAQNKALRNNI